MNQPALKEKEKKKEYNRRYYSQNRERALEYVKIWRSLNPEKRKAAAKRQYIANTQKKLAAIKKWYQTHPEAAKILAKRKNDKARSTPKGKLSRNTTSNISRSLHGTKTRRHWGDLVGYTLLQLKSHLEKLFTPEMSWDNYGTYWEVDHIIPKVAFNFEKPEDIDFKKCWALSNLRPLEKQLNRKKQGKIYQPFQPSLLIGNICQL